MVGLNCPLPRLMPLTLPGVCCPPVSANGSRDLAVQRTCHALHFTYGFTLRTGLPCPYRLASQSPIRHRPTSLVINTLNMGLIWLTEFTGRKLLNDLSPRRSYVQSRTAPRPRLILGAPLFVRQRHGSATAPSPTIGLRLVGSLLS